MSGRPAGPPPGPPPGAFGGSGSGGPGAWGKQFVKFSCFRLRPELRAAPAAERARVGAQLRALIDASAARMVTRLYSTVGTRADVDWIAWQAADELPPIMDWQAELLRSAAGPYLDRPYSYLSMTMRSLYRNPLHDGGEARDRLRADGGTDDYLFVYPMVKTRAWYELPGEERQRMMEEHIRVGHDYHGIKINTTYSYGLDDQEFVVAFEGNEPGEFLALVRALRDTEASRYTERDTPMFTCRRMGADDLCAHLGLAARSAEPQPARA